jgi:cell division protein FtsL
MRRQKSEDRRQKMENRRRTFTFYSLSSVVCPLFSVFCLLIFNSGCLDTNKQQTTLADQVDKLEEQNAQLQKQIEQTKSENEELKSQVQVLSGMPEQVKGENLYHLKKIKIGRYTDLYDKDKDGKMERLIVYIQPIDEDGDIIKAAGDVDVQLWNLSKEQDQALLCKGHVKGEELKKLWFAALMTHYRLEFNVTGKIDEFKDPLTVKVVFTDYLTGKVFKEQKVIEPR